MEPAELTSRSTSVSPHTVLEGGADSGNAGEDEGAEAPGDVCCIELDDT